MNRKSFLTKDSKRTAFRTKQKQKQKPGRKQKTGNIPEKSSDAENTSGYGKPFPKDIPT
jgi:hypothetical protein